MYKRSFLLGVLLLGLFRFCAATDDNINTIVIRPQDKNSDMIEVVNNNSDNNNFNNSLDGIQYINDNNAGLLENNNANASSSSSSSSSSKDDNNGNGPASIIKKDDTSSFSILTWFKERTKTQLGGIFAGLGAGIYGIYKLITVAMGNDEDEVQQEVVKPLVKRDHEILVAFSDAMIADVEHLKAGEEVAPSTELFDFSDMENERVMKEGEIVKRTFVYLYNECKESPEKVEALEGFTTTLKQDIVEMPVTA